MDDFLAVLQKSALFKGKSKSEINIRLSNIDYKLKSYQKNDLLFAVESHADFLGTVLTGSVEVQKSFPDGKIVTVARLAPAQTFGGFILFSEKPKYPVSIVASDDCKVLLISKKNLLELFRADTQLLSNFIKSIADRLIFLHEKIELLSLSSISKKIAYYLIKESEKQKSTNIVQLPFSKTTWAEHINVSRVSLSRELKKMTSNGLLIVNKKTIALKNFNNLKTLLLDVEQR